MESPEPEKSGTRLTVRDHSLNAVQAILKAIPYVGESLEQFIFGPLTEIRMQRIETTLQEVAFSLEALGKTANINSEEFANLLEKVAPKLSRATNEEKRKRFRDLLLNAVVFAEEDSDWAGVDLASRLLDEIEAPGLAILAAIAKFKDESPLALVSKPVTQLYKGEPDLDDPNLQIHHSISYDWVVVEEWARRLREKRLVSYRSHDARGGFGGVALRELGQFLVDWIVAADNQPVNQT